MYTLFMVGMLLDLVYFFADQCKAQCPALYMIIQFAPYSCFASNCSARRPPNRFLFRVFRVFRSQNRTAATKHATSKLLCPHPLYESNHQTFHFKSCVRDPYRAGCQSPRFGWACIFCMQGIENGHGVAGCYSQ